VTISKILSKTVILEMGFKHEKLQYTLHKFAGFTRRKYGIIEDNNKNLPYDRTGNVTVCTFLITYL
jgi:hypothetical protein